jgi:hypothetical protein
MMWMMRWVKASALALAFGACAWGCGIKSAPIAPELARPERVAGLRASADPTGIKLSWERPTHYVSGHSMRDLGSFVILRGDGGGTMQPLVELPVTDQERFAVEREFTYVDGETTVDHRYSYQIVSKTLDGYASDASDEVDFTRVKPSPTPNPENFQLPGPSSVPTTVP